jgi:hypothetical protein
MKLIQPNSEVGAASRITANSSWTIGQAAKMLETVLYLRFSTNSPTGTCGVPVTKLLNWVIDLWVIARSIHSTVCRSSGSGL